MLFLGFQLQFEINLFNNLYSLQTPTGREQVGQIARMYRIWRHMVEFALKVPELPTVIQFCHSLLDRQISLYHEYKAQFMNIYKPRVAEYFKEAPPKTTNQQNSNHLIDITTTNYSQLMEITECEEFMVTQSSSAHHLTNTFDN